MFDKELNQTLKELLRGGVGIARMGEEKAGEENLKILGDFSQGRGREKAGRKKLEKEVRAGLFQAGVSDTSSIVSVSHTSSTQGSWILVVGSDQFVGVDLEASTRRVHPEVLFRVASAEERNDFDWNVLKFWVVKEAAFKSNPNNRGTLLPGYRVEQWDPVSQEGLISLPTQEDGRSQGWTCRFRFLELGNWYIALAHTFRK